MSTTSRAALTRNSSGRSGSAPVGRVAQQPPSRRVGGHDVPPPVRGDHALHHGFDQRRRLGLLAAELARSGRRAAGASAGATAPAASMSGMPERGKRGGVAGGDRPRGRGDVGERLGDRARGRRARARCRPSRASSGRPPRSPCARRTISSTCARSAATRTTPGPPGTATYISRRPTVSLRRAATPGRPSSAWRTSGRPAWFSIVGEAGPGGKSLSARTRPVRSTRVMRWPFCAGPADAPTSSQPSESAGSASRISRASCSSPTAMSPSRSRRSDRSALQRRIRP